MYAFSHPFVPGAIRPTTVILLLLVFVSCTRERLVTEIITYSPDASINSRQAFFYDGDGLLIRSETTESDPRGNNTYFYTYDSEKRCTLRKRYANGELADSLVYRYTPSGEKSEYQYYPKPKAEPWSQETLYITHYASDGKQKEHSYATFYVFPNGDTIMNPGWRTLSFYDEKGRLVLDSTFFSGAPFPTIGTDGQIIVRVKVRNATVTEYKYENNLLVEKLSRDPWDNQYIEFHEYDRWGRELCNQFISIYQSDTTYDSRYTTLSRAKGIRVYTEYSSYTSTLHEQWVNRKGQTICSNSIDPLLGLICENRCTFNRCGDLVEYTFRSFGEIQPINSSGDNFLSSRTVYLYK